MIIKKAEQYVKSQYRKDFYKFHVMVVKKCALRLADQLGGDKEILELAVLFHDSTINTHGNRIHHITGAESAERFLTKEDYPQERIEHVKQCILTHRVNDEVPKSLEAKILASADAEAHLRTFPFIAHILITNIGMEEAINALKEKIDRNWNKKMLPESKETVKEHYKIIKKTLEELS